MNTNVKHKSIVENKTEQQKLSPYLWVGLNPIC